MINPNLEVVWNPFYNNENVNNENWSSFSRKKKFKQKITQE